MVGLTIDTLCMLSRSLVRSLLLSSLLVRSLSLALPHSPSLSPVSRSFLAISRPVSHSRLNNPYTLTIFSSVLHSRRLRRCGLFFDCSIDVASSLQFNDVDSNFLSVALAPCSLLVQKFWLPVSHLTFSWAPEKRRLEQFLVASEAIESNRGKEQSTSMCKFDNSNDMKGCYQESTGIREGGWDPRYSDLFTIIIFGSCESVFICFSDYTGMAKSSVINLQRQFCRLSPPLPRWCKECWTSLFQDHASKSPRYRKVRLSRQNVSSSSLVIKCIHILQLTYWI